MSVSIQSCDAELPPSHPQDPWKIPGLASFPESQPNPIFFFFFNTGNKAIQDHAEIDL